ncbi:hypothetical protein ACS0TY_033948 [Phlomoides rotata]
MANAWQPNAAAAAKRHTPVILELGGKCPVMVDSNINLTVITRRIISVLHPQQCGTSNNDLHNEFDGHMFSLSLSDCGWNDSISVDCKSLT